MTQPEMGSNRPTIYEIRDGISTHVG
jgi:hypothetical protein